MSAFSPTTDPNTLLFPAFTYGDHASCRRKMKAEAKKWVKRYDAHGDFPEPKLIPVPPGSAIFMGTQNEVALMNMGMGIAKTSGITPIPPTMYDFREGSDRNASHWFFTSWISSGAKLPSM